MPPNTYTPTPYGYAPVPEPPRQWPVPAARHVPLIWTITLAAVTVMAIGLSALAPYVTPTVPAPSGTTAYANSLARNDNAWSLSNNFQGHCAYANGGLDATANTYNANEVNGEGLTLIGSYDPAALCTLQGQNPTDLRLSVRILPQANLNYTLQPAIFVHSSVALVFTTAGEFAVLFRETSADQWQIIYEGPTNQWHTADMLSNTVVVQTRSDSYTIALNGAVIYHGDFGGFVTDFPASGTIALGAFTTLRGGGGEAAFADLSLTTP
jgi:hypothetical protein